MKDVVNELKMSMNGPAGGHWSEESAGRSALAAAAGESPAPGAAPTAGRSAAERAAIGAIILFWLVQFLSFTLERWLREPQAESLLRLEARAIVSVIGALISVAILRILQRRVGLSFVKLALLSLALALAGATLHSLANWAVFQALIGPPPGEDYSLASIPSYLSLIYLFSWVYLAITVILLSITYGEELRRRERRIVELSSEAERAQAALRRHGGKAPEIAEVWVRKGSQQVRLASSAIDWVEAEGEYVRFHAGSHSYLDRQSISAVEEKFAPAGFLRIHRSTIVNPDRIESLSRTRWGSLQVHLRGGVDLRVSKSFQPIVRKRLQGSGE